MSETCILKCQNIIILLNKVNSERDTRLNTNEEIMTFYTDTLTGYDECIQEIMPQDNNELITINMHITEYITPL